MFLTPLKNRLIDDRTRPVRILGGPFRGATICMNLRENLRKVFGVYEHELNGWLRAALPRVDAVLDIGANDGYFAFGCAAAFRRAGKAGRIIAFEPQSVHCEQLRATAQIQSRAVPEVTVSIEQTLVGSEVTAGQSTLDSFVQRAEKPLVPRRTMLKIDVEGAEIDVIAGASLWLDPSNCFLIEVHEERFGALLQERFAAAGLSLDAIGQSPLPWLGRERRQVSNSWLVSRLS
jgi:hypothetical protein